MDTLQKSKLFSRTPYKDDIPVSEPEEKDTGHGLRKRLTSSVKIQPSLSSASRRAWAFRRSKSLSSFGEAVAAGGAPIRRLWDRGWGWLLSKKPTFAADLEMNEEETNQLGGHSRGTLRHIFYKVRSEIRKLLNNNNVTLPTTKGFRYNSFSYRQNFDDGQRSPEPAGMD